MPFTSAISLRKYTVIIYFNCIIKMGKYFVLQIAGLHVKWSLFTVRIRCCQTNPMGITHILIQLGNESHVAYTRIAYTPHQAIHTRFNEVHLKFCLLG
jgi:hypothetical protein